MSKLGHAFLIGVCAVMWQGCSDVPVESEQDADTTDTGSIVDTGSVLDTGAAIDTSTPEDTGAVEMDTGTADTGAADTAMGEAGCSSGTFCMDGTVCKAGVCTACTTDTECSSIHALRRCYDGVCKIGNCNPKATPTGCTAEGAVCCTTETTAGTCFARSGETSCCDDSACASLPKLTKCNLTLHACGCPAPTPGEIHVSPTGVDSNPLRGNGSAACPYKTIGEALFALSSATVKTTIILDKAETGVATFGSGCTGGSPCDSTPITIPATIANGLVIKGGGATPADVLVTGDGTSLFDVRAPGVGFANLTLKPTREGTNNSGGTAIIFNAPAGSTAAPEESVQNVVIQGKYATSALAGTGTGILLSNAASPTLGPGLTIDGGFLGINVTGPARPTIVGSMSAATTIGGVGDNCLRAHSSSAVVTGFHIKSLDTTKSVTIRDCGSRAISIDNTAAATTASRIENAIIRKTPAGGAFDAIVVRTAASLEVENVDILDVAGRGFLVDAGAVSSRPKLSIKTATVTAPSGVGALFQGYGTVNVDGLTIDGSASVGVQVNGFAQLTAKALKVKDSASIGVQILGTTTATVDGLVIEGGASTGLNVLGGAVTTFTSGDIRNTTGAGVIIQGSAQATFNTLVVKGSKNIGFRALETSDVSLDGADIRESTFDGLRCEGTAKLKIRKSSFLQNITNGVWLTGACLADLGSDSDPGENTFNRTSLKNTTSGLCINSTATRPTPSASSFGCGQSATTCTSVASIPASFVSSATSCQVNRDLTVSGGGLLVISPKCCG